MGKARKVRCGCAFLLMGLCLTAQAAEKSNAPRAPRGPVDIRSDRLTVLQKKHRAVFSGNVQAVQGDLTIHCERLTVSYESSDGKRTMTGEIRRMIFEGQVEITQNQRKGHCQRAEYDRRKGLMICTGEPWVVEGDNKIRGTRIEYYLDKDEVRVVRPRALIRLDEAGKKKGGSPK